MHDVQTLVASLAAVDSMTWRPMAEAPRDGRWIIALAADLASVFRIGWGREDGSYPTWSTFEYSYGDSFFVGWIPSPQDPPSWQSRTPQQDGNTAGAAQPPRPPPAGPHPFSDPEDPGRLLGGHYHPGDDA